MKHGTMVVVLLVVPFACQAQLAMGRKYIGGSITYAMNATPDALSNNIYNDQFSVSPSMGFMVSDRLALGVNAGFSYSFSDNTSFNLGRYTTESKTYSAGVFMTRFSHLADDKFFFFLNGGVNYSRLATDTFIDSNGAQYNSESYVVSAIVRPGFIFLPNARWGITMSLGSLTYNHIRGIGNEATENRVSLDLGTVGMGFLYFFN